MFGRDFLAVLIHFLTRVRERGRMYQLQVQLASDHADEYASGNGIVGTVPEAVVLGEGADGLMDGGSGRLG